MDGYCVIIGFVLMTVALAIAIVPGIVFGPIVAFLEWQDRRRKHENS